MSKEDTTIGDMLENEKQMFLEAEEKYGAFFSNASGFNELLNNFLKEVDPSAWIFVLFLGQIKKHHLLALFSSVRRHHVQSMLNMRQVLEGAVNASFGLANPDQKAFVVSEDDGTLSAPQKLQNRRYAWLEENYPDKSKHMKVMKTSINQCAHSSMIYGFLNFDMSDAKKRAFSMSFFDKDDEYLTKTDLWMIGNVAMGILDLFTGVNQKEKRVKFKDGFVERLLELEKENHRLKAEMQKHPRYIATQDRVNSVDQNPGTNT